MAKQKKILKQFKKAAKDGTLGRGTLVKKHGKSVKKSVVTPEVAKVLFSFDQILQLRDRDLLSNQEARELLGIADRFKKEASNDTDSARNEAQNFGEVNVGKSSYFTITDTSTKDNAYSTDYEQDNTTDTSDTSVEQTNAV